MASMFDERFTEPVLNDLMPPERADEFFDAMYGDASEGAYDIRLVLNDQDTKGNSLTFQFQLLERPGKCLACNLTYGLPDVFGRHPLINVKGIVEKIGTILGERATIEDWSLGRTQSISKALHTIPLIIRLG